MNSEVLQKPTSLLDWENHLVPQAHAVELLGEIPISEEERRQLGTLLGITLRRLSLSEVNQVIKRRYRAAFAVFLVAQGIYGYEGGSFWPGCKEIVGRDLDSNWTTELGRLFEDILIEFGLPLFPDMLHSRRYVDLILVHGGIPNYSMQDYFNHLLRPSVSRDLYADMPVEELIDDWLHYAGGRYSTDKPVLRFLEFGGQVAQDFVERSRELAREFLETGLVSDPAEIGLPRRVVEAFHTWAVEEDGLDPATTRSERTGLRLRKPEILLDPWGEGLILELPRQQIPATMSQEQFAWRVQSGEQTVTLTTRIRRAGYDLRTTPESLSLGAPAAAYEVTFLVNGQPKRSWRYDGFAPAHPLLVFDPGRGTLLKRGHALPARFLWLLYPLDARLDFEGPADLREAFPRLPWGWANFHGQAWDLSQVTTLTLTQAGGQITTIPIRPDEASQRPHLVGGQLFEADLIDAAAVPLYIGPPPSVRIPLVGRTSQAEELRRWRVTIRHKWAAQPALDRAWTLADLPLLKKGEDVVELPLDQAKLLGRAPYGSFVVRLRGPLGRDAELPFRVLPRLAITGYEDRYLPDPQTGPPPIILLVETEAGDELEAYAEGHPCQVEPVDRQFYQVTVPPDDTTITLTVTKPVSGGEPVRVPAHVPLRRLRWALAGLASAEGEDQRRAWTGRLIRRPLDALLQAESPALLLDLGGPDMAASTAGQADPLSYLTLCLVDQDGRLLQQEHITRPQSGRRQAICLAYLSAFLDTINQSPSPIVRFELTWPDAAVEGGLRRLPVLSLTREMAVSQVQGQMRRLNGQLKVHLTWQESVRLRHRRLRCWPLWRPWLPPYEQPIPDEAEGEVIFEAPLEQMPPGKYRLEFRVIDPWAAEEPAERPPPDALNTFTFEMIKADERLQQIEQGLKGRPAGLGHLVARLRKDKSALEVSSPFALLLERATICAQTDQPDQTREDLQHCFDRLDEAALPQTLALCELAQQSDDQRLMTALRLKLFAPGRLRRLLDQRQAGQVTPAQLQAYLAYLPRSGLLPLPTCQQLLQVEDEQVQLYAILQLLKRGDVLGLSTVVDRVKSDRLSEADAVTLLKLNLDLAVAYLEEKLDDPMAIRLLTALSGELGERAPIVRPGHWVYSSAGWGQLQCIEETESGQVLEQFVKGQSGLKLYLTLRPHYDAEPVTIELRSDRYILTFQEANRVYRCTKSDTCQFITRQQSLLLNEHNHIVHGGVGPQYMPQNKARFLSAKPLTYNVRAPRNQLR